MFDGFVGNARGGGIVNLDGSGWLRVAHFVEGCADAAGFSSIVVEGTTFGLGGGPEYMFYDTAFGVDQAILRQRGIG